MTVKKFVDQYAQEFLLGLQSSGLATKQKLQLQNLRQQSFGYLD
ncbi:hypothetical protein [Corynebacterium diphtheriae]|nr:hypothetical protein [Corynebacterium diphtheriae]